MDADVKAGPLDLAEHALEAGWTLRRACGVLEVNHARVLGWYDRLAGDGADGLVDRAPGPAQAPRPVGLGA